LSSSILHLDAFCPIHAYKCATWRKKDRVCERKREGERDRQKERERERESERLRD
jgi:hypothetical protein